MENTKNKTSNLIDQQEKKDNQNLKQKTSKDDFDDPYGGTLKKTNFLLFTIICVSAAALVIGVIWILFIIISKKTINMNLIQLPIIISLLGFAILISACILKNIVEKKRNSSYSSTYQMKDFHIAQKEITIEKSKKGEATTETKLTITETKEGYMFCPHCKMKIPSSSKIFCPKCGKRLDSTNLNANSEN